MSKMLNRLNEVQKNNAGSGRNNDGSSDKPVINKYTLVVEQSQGSDSQDDPKGFDPLRALQPQAVLAPLVVIIGLISLVGLGLSVRTFAQTREGNAGTRKMAKIIATQSKELKVLDAQVQKLSGVQDAQLKNIDKKIRVIDKQLGLLNKDVSEITIDTNFSRVNMDNIKISQKKLSEQIRSLNKDITDIRNFRAID